MYTKPLDLKKKSKQGGCVIVLINACRGLKFPFTPQDIWDNFNLWSTERTGALT